MRHTGSGRRNQRHVIIINEGAMRQHRPPCQQAEITQCSGIALAHPVMHMMMFPVTFRTVGLHMRPRFHRQRAQPAQRRSGTAENETRGDGRQHPPVITGKTGHGFDKAGGIGNGNRRRGIAVIVRAAFGKVHRHPADKRALAHLDADFGKPQAGFIMDGGKIHRGCCAIGQQPAHQRAIDAVSKIEIRIPGFQWKGMGLQPDFQRHIQCLTQLRELRRMDMQIDKARQQHALAAQIGHGRRGGEWPAGGT